MNINPLETSGFTPIGPPPSLSPSRSQSSSPIILDLDRQPPANKVSQENESLEMDLNNSPSSKRLKSSQQGLELGGFDAQMGMNNGKDSHCWICHKEKSNTFCKLCIRGFHLKCLPPNSTQERVVGDEKMDGWNCIECRGIMKAEDGKTRSSTLKNLTPDEFCQLLKYALQTIRATADPTFYAPVSEAYYPEYKECILHPMDLLQIERNINRRIYGSPEALLADIKWIVHNSYIFNAHNHPLTKNANYFFKVAKNEMAEIEVCPNCFKNFYTNDQEKWFIQPCEKPHALVWARLKGHPFWPAKVVRLDKVKKEVDARFFGAHERAWVPLDSCYLLSEHYLWGKPKGQKGKFETASKELYAHIARINELFPNKFQYAKPKTLLNPKQMYIFPEDATDSNEDESGDEDDEERNLTIDETFTVQKGKQQKKRKAQSPDIKDTPTPTSTTSSRFIKKSTTTPNIPKVSETQPSKIKMENKPQIEVVYKPDNFPRNESFKNARMSLGGSNSTKRNPKLLKLEDKESESSLKDIDKMKEEILRMNEEKLFEKSMFNERIRENDHNAELMRLEMQNCMVMDKEQAIKHLRTEMEEKHKKEIDGIKRKQWCASCLAESQYFCCWNTSYCSYNCQSKHWPKHMGECQQSQQQSPGAVSQATNLQSTPPPPTQSR